LYVASLSGSKVIRYDALTATPTDFVSSGSGGLSLPTSLEFGNDGNLYVLSTNPVDEVLRYNGITGAFIDVFVSAGSGGLTNGQGLTFGPDGNLYVANTLPIGEVLRYDGVTGASMGTFVSTAAGLVNPRYLHFGPNGDLFVSEISGSIFSFDGSTGAANGVSPLTVQS